MDPLNQHAPDAGKPSPEAQDARTGPTPRESVTAEAQPLPADSWLKNNRAGRRSQESRSRHSRHRGRGRGRRGRGPSDHEKTRRWLIVASVILLIGVAFSAGFLKGKDGASDSERSAGSAKTEIVFPTSESEALLDNAFALLGEGNARRALLEFQKVQDRQPGLYGIDYLVAEAAYRAGEKVLAQQSAERSLSKEELSGEAQVLLAFLVLEKSAGDASGAGPKFSDPLTEAEDALRRYAAAHPLDARVYCQWGDLLRSRGSYRSAAELLHRGRLRADPGNDQSLLAAKEALAKLQNEPAREVPSLSVITSMSGEQSVAAALAALQRGQQGDAQLFLERAKEFYPRRVFAELLQDGAFDQYRTDPKMKGYLTKPSDGLSSVERP